LTVNGEVQNLKKNNLVVFRVRDLILINLNGEELKRDFLCAKYLEIYFIPRDRLSKFFF
jgi:hypothetical protein